jgi:glycosyltransferase involved in cell wall biosynthesis
MKIWPQLYKNKKSDLEIITIKKAGNKKNALIIYIPWAIKEWINNTYNDENYNGHSMYWESIEMVRILSAKGYNVDVADCTGPLPKMEWAKYQLVIDERNNIKDASFVAGQLRIHYSTGCQWLFHNTAEYMRLLDFRKRTGISMQPQRQIQSIFSEEIADYTTYFGGNFQRDLFTHPGKTYPLNLSSAFIAAFKEKEIKNSRHNFLWLGSRGFIHKGLDIVLEAFKQARNFNLHICANLEAEPEFYAWYKKEFSSCANITYHGWKNLNDLKFQALAENCIATVYCSAAEGGAGAVVQAMQFGCIPVVNNSTALRGQHTGFHLKGEISLQLISSITEILETIAGMSEKDLYEKSAAVRAYANKNHSKNAYSSSFSQFIDLIENG